MISIKDYSHLSESAAAKQYEVDVRQALVDLKMFDPSVRCSEPATSHCRAVTGVGLQLWTSRSKKEHLKFLKALRKANLISDEIDHGKSGGYWHIQCSPRGHELKVN